ncbi:MAG: BrnA antitoxin family protein [Bifidobacteriaceae bacterium]|nr:BrnA antitoxin family protein [Bifidobacteriaceae bacterium]
MTRGAPSRSQTRDAAHGSPSAGRADELRDEYDFTAARANPYSRRLKKQVTIRLDVDTIDYFKAMAGQTGVPYQSLINLYLADCAANERELTLTWA